MMLRPFHHSEHLGDVAVDHGAAAEAAVVLGGREPEIAAGTLHRQRQVLQAVLHVGAGIARPAAAHAVDASKRSCVVDASTAVGRDLNRLFAGFVTREFGADSFEVERVSQLPQQHPQEVQT